MPYRKEESKLSFLNLLHKVEITSYLTHECWVRYTLREFFAIDYDAGCSWQLVKMLVYDL
jgi:hypothetical protein